MILITGATGRTGKEAATLLAAKGVKVRALVRNPDKAAGLKAAGVELAVGDASDATAVRAALQGVEKIAVIHPVLRQTTAAARSATAIMHAASNVGEAWVTNKCLAMFS